MRSSKRLITIEPYDCWLTVVLCDDVSRAAKNVLTSVDQWDEPFSASGLCVKKDNKDYFIYILRSCNYLNIIPHEVFHFVCHLKDDFGLEEEACAYMQGYLTEKILGYVVKAKPIK